MNKKTLEALKDSIAHWDRMSKGKAGPLEIPDADNCALCRIYNNGFNRVNRGCAGCPVMAKTGESVCRSTPFMAAHRAWQLKGIKSLSFQYEAVKMRNFLKSLLPKPVRKPDLVLKCKSGAKSRPTPWGAKNGCKLPDEDNEGPMTDKEINEAIASIVGFQKLGVDPDYEWRRPISGGYGGGYCNSVPDYVNSLDDMHRAEKVMSGVSPRAYDRVLNKELVAAGIEFTWEATARIKAIAFLKTHGKWRY